MHKKELANLQAHEEVLLFLEQGILIQFQQEPKQYLRDI